MRISVIGTGYVGLVTGVCLAEVGHDVTCVDVDPVKVQTIRSGKTPIFEEGLEPLLQRHLGKRLWVTETLRDAVLESDVTFIAVGTPFDGKEIDLTYIRQAAREIGRALADKASYHLVIVKSTVIPGTTDNVVAPIVAEESGKVSGRDFGVGMNPEFLTEGVAVQDFMDPDRIVLGGADEKAIETMAAIYAPFKDAPTVRTNNKTAELIKYASNATLATMISFSNEIANLATRLGGIDAAEVMKAVHLARYFTTTLKDGQRVTAPIASFLYAGCGFGGSCLPKDVSALAAQGASAGEPMRILNSVLEINRERPERTVAILRKHFPSLRGVRVAVLGLAFKSDTDDIRQSPALPIIDLLLQDGAAVSAFDPIAIEPARKALPEGKVSFAESLEEAVRGAEAVVITTSWKEFGRLPALLSDVANPPVVIDGRRMLDKRSVRRYDGIGL
ncbi:MAG: nucleotide sugar dehydrogenase [Alphaproteobacteria bacterium]|nr:nucleotide sugar dehydrogenase [Alphaproteobacteria bacterium]